MKPINHDDNNCISQSSDCVIYNGASIPCVGIKNGDCLTKSVHDLACKLCTVLSGLDVSSYDLSCFDLTRCAPEDFTQLLQLLIDRICALEGIESPTGGTKGCPDCVVNLASCFQYQDLKTLDMVITSQLTDYVTLIGNTFCELLSQQGFTVQSLQNQGARLGVVEKTVATILTTPPALPSITPVCVLGAAPTTIDIVLQALEKQFCELRAATGQPSDLFNGIATQPTGLNTLPALGTQGGTMGSIPGWRTVVNNVGDAITNLWLTVSDLRSAVTNIQLNCCATPCQGVSIQLQATMPTVNNLILFFTGSIPQGLVECSIAGTVFNIADQSGHNINVTIPLVATMNNPGGFTVSIGGTPLNVGDNLTITSDICLKDNTLGTVCESCLEYIFVCTLNCPATTFIAGLTSMFFSFPHISGTKTYTVALYDSTGNTLLQSQTFPELNPTTVSGTFSGLTKGTTYKIRIFVVGNNGVQTCPLTVVTTLPNPCPPPSAITALISIP